MHKHTLTKEQKRMYAAEKLNNFRWISKALATRSSYVLTDTNLAPYTLNDELSELGQFAEVTYSSVPIEFLFQNASVLMEPEFPLEGYTVLQECVLISSIKGPIGYLPAYVAYRPSTKQLVVAISGTASLLLAYHDLRALKHRHPSGRGSVHTGFLDLYKGIKPLILEAIQKGLKGYDVNELVITGHSMGGSIAYLLCIDLLESPQKVPLSPGLCLKLAVFGTPRTGNAELVKYWEELVTTYRREHGHDRMTEYSVIAYNDGVPALPPFKFGYKHFAKEPFYLDKSRLYKIPASQSECTLFTVSPPAGDTSIPKFPRGGHNYYNGRDLERFARRIIWLDESRPQKSGWEERYRTIVAKRRT